MLIFSQLANLERRDSVQCLRITVKTGAMTTSLPNEYAGNRMRHAIEELTNMPMSEFVLRLEGYFISGKERKDNEEEQKTLKTWVRWKLRTQLST